MTPPSLDRKTFLKYLQASGLLEPRELKAVLKRLPETNRGKVVARALVEWGLLTKFQAELLLAGRTSGFFVGQYRILEPIGHGGMGRVFKAVHQTMNRVVALKVLAPQQMKTERARELFQREVRAAGRLMHPNIVTAYDASCTDGRHYLAMEYVEGPNLERLVRDRGPLPIGPACEIMRQAATGLQYAFEMGTVHRDVKPSNLLVQAAPATDASPVVVKILDFGLARLQESTVPAPQRVGTILAPDHTIMGTPDYLSPEQSRDLHGVDIRSDLYSLGCTFYYLLTGQVPFPGGNALEKIIRHSADEATPIEAYRPEVPAGVAAVVRRLMAKEPADRYQTPADVAAALAPFCTAASPGWCETGNTLASSTDTDTATPSPLPAEAPVGAEAAPDGVLDATLSGPSAMPTSDDLLAVLEPLRHGRKALLWVSAVAVAAAAVIALILLSV